jgi:glucan phosphoethanolaminetransferase (alkaline phosphatase superfamily)
VIIKATDANGNTAFLQVVGIGNGPIQQTDKNTAGTTTVVQTHLIWWPLVLALILILIAFWLGKRQQLEQIRARLRAGLRPF